MNLFEVVTNNNKIETSVLASLPPELKNVKFKPHYSEKGVTHKGRITIKHNPDIDKHFEKYGFKQTWKDHDAQGMEHKDGHAISFHHFPKEKITNIFVSRPVEKKIANDPLSQHHMTADKIGMVASEGSRRDTAKIKNKSGLRYNSKITMKGIKRKNFKKFDQARF